MFDLMVEKGLEPSIIEGFDPNLYELKVTQFDALLLDKTTRAIVIRIAQGHVHVESTNTFPIKAIFTVKSGRAYAYTDESMRVVPEKNTEVFIYGKGSIEINVPCTVKCHDEVTGMVNVPKTTEHYSFEFYNRTHCTHRSGDVTVLHRAYVRCSTDSIGTIAAFGSVHVSGNGFCTVHLYKDASMETCGRETVIAHDQAHVNAHSENSKITLLNQSTCCMTMNATVHACNQSVVEQHAGTCYVSGFATIFRYRANKTCVKKDGPFFGIVHRTPARAEQDMIVYKAAMASIPVDSRYVLIKVVVKMLIKKGTALRCGGYNKWRAESATVLEIFDKDHNPLQSAYSHHDNNFLYCLNDKVSVSDFNMDHDECSTGVHFFLSELEAWNYQL